jgi:hypothetical protein
VRLEVNGAVAGGEAERPAPSDDLTGPVIIVDTGPVRLVPNDLVLIVEVMRSARPPPSDAVVIVETGSVRPAPSNTASGGATPILARVGRSVAVAGGGTGGPARLGRLGSTAPGRGWDAERKRVRTTITQREADVRNADPLKKFTHLARPVPVSRGVVRATKLAKLITKLARLITKPIRRMTATCSGDKCICCEPAAVRGAGQEQKATADLI